MEPLCTLPVDDRNFFGTPQYFTCMIYIFLGTPWYFLYAMTVHVVTLEPLCSLPMRWQKLLWNPSVLSLCDDRGYFGTPLYFPCVMTEFTLEPLALYFPYVMT